MRICERFWSREKREHFLISATGAHVILMTGRKTLIYKEFGPVFSIDAMYGWYCYDFISTDKRMYDII